MAYTTVSGKLPSQSAVMVVPLGTVPYFGQYNSMVSRVAIASPVTITGAAANNVTFDVRRTSAGTTTSIASLTLASGTNLPAGTEVDLSITASTVLAGDWIDVQMTQNGTGLPVPEGVLVRLEIQ